MKSEDQKHGYRFEKILKGKKVDSCRYMTKEEADDFGWYKRPLCIIFTDETYLVLQSDDEGNDGGTGFIGGGKEEHIIYTI